MTKAKPGSVVKRTLKPIMIHIIIMLYNGPKSVPTVQYIFKISELENETSCHFCPSYYIQYIDDFKF